MGEPLLHPVTKRFVDRSTKKVFAFSFYCDKCDKEWRSTPQAFESSDLNSSTDLIIFRMLWSGQHKAAYDQANLEAIYAFHYCQACGRRICMECFCRSETDIGEICKDCLSKKETDARKEKFPRNMPPPEDRSSTSSK